MHVTCTVYHTKVLWYSYLHQITLYDSLGYTKGEDMDNYCEKMNIIIITILTKMLDIIPCTVHTNSQRTGVLIIQGNEYAIYYLIWYLLEIPVNRMYSSSWHNELNDNLFKRNLPYDLCKIDCNISHIYLRWPQLTAE